MITLSNKFKLFNPSTFCQLCARVQYNFKTPSNIDPKKDYY